MSHVLSLTPSLCGNSSDWLKCLARMSAAVPRRGSGAMRRLADNHSRSVYGRAILTGQVPLCNSAFRHQKIGQYLKCSVKRHLW